ncbi:unnamed protein product [Mytilus edulis]|uniref:CARD domain-containing protein n=1 Tax=Mytilus edulis TaxID=6550 RepID=A0A8S3SC06_MYTED|nr:unnamed protein product [Mytilus edulis]
MIRRNTFILEQPKVEEPVVMSGKDRQNIMRLRINRIAIVQELRVEYILNYLKDCGVINEDDQRKIDMGTTPSDKARRLVDLLPSKTHIQDWYQSFREALLNPEGGPEVKKRCKAMVEFLDNTVIHRPTSQNSRLSGSDASSMKLPHYEPLPMIHDKEPRKSIPQNVLNLESERHKGTVMAAKEDYTAEKGVRDVVPEREDKMIPWSSDQMDSMTLVKGFFQQWVTTPDNFRSLIQVPEDHFKRLQESSALEDKEQLAAETKTLEKMRKLELVTVMARRKLLPEGFELCMCDVVHEVLFDKDNYHYYFKYLKNLELSDVNLMVDVVSSFASIMNNMEPTKGGVNMEQAVKLGFNLIDFVAEYGYFTQAEVIMTVLLMVLNKSQNMDTWMAKYKGLVKLMHFRNMNYDFQGVQMAYNLSNELMWKIDMMSFGQDLVDKGEYFIELSTLMLEYGSANASFGYIQKAMKEVKTEDPANIVHALCQAVMVYSAKWSIKRAETLAVEAVQQAKEHFGCRHPLYIKALLHFCHFSSEFKQDQPGVDVAKHTLDTAKIVYGCETIQLALAHRALAKALLVVQKFDNMDYHYHATEALRMARGLLPDKHPMLHLFLHTSASALQWKALHSSKDLQNSTLRLAETQAIDALEIVAIHYSEISLCTARMCVLLGQIKSKMDMVEEADELLHRAIIYMKLCQPENSNYLLLAMATLATLHKIFNKPKEAVNLFSHVVTHVDSSGVYLKWVHVCYDHLINTLQSLNQNKEADEFQIQLSQWLRDNPVYDKQITMEDLTAKPEPFSKFLDNFNVWEKRTKKVLDFAKRVVAAGEDKS